MIQQAGVLAPIAAGPLVSWLNNYAAIHQVDLELIPGYTPIDSSNAEPSLWQQLAQDIRKLSSNYEGVLILHGTDTMAYTAAALSFLLPNLTCPVILTGSQIPLAEPNSDAELNLNRSLNLLINYASQLPREVFIFFGHALFRGNRATKIDNESQYAFDSPNYPSCLRYTAHDKIEFNSDFAALRRLSLAMPICHSLAPIKIKVRLLAPGLQELDIEPNSCVALILMTYGAGNAPTNPDFLAAIQKLTAQGVLVLNLSQCLRKTTKLNNYAVGCALRDVGVIDMGDITLEACIAKLYYLFNSEVANLKKYLSLDLVGEM